MIMERTINASTRDAFDVDFTDIPSSGYLWQAVDPPDGLTLLSEGYADKEPEGIGVPRHWVFTFRAERPGDFTLRFALRRPWEAAAEREETVRVLVT
ncbi:hypothetical protein ACZ90_22685 [Streptomyces albus subsp. albus]|nr:hypothetical protein ACZ90_22685 [Streptomyces albus subsp. albus]